MKYAIVFIDQENHLIKISYQTTVRTIAFKDIAKNQGFLEQIMDFYETIYIVEKHKKVEKEVLKELIVNLYDIGQQDAEEEKVEQEKKVEQEEQKKRDNIIDDLKNTEMEEEDIENSTLIRSSLEGCLHVEDLDLRFDGPADYYDLSKLDPDQVKRSRHLKACLQQGTLVKTTMKEINEIGKKIAEEEKARDNKKTLGIVDRKKMDDSEDGDETSDRDLEPMEITSGAVGESIESFSTVDDSTEIVTDNGAINAGEIKGMFSNMFNKDSDGVSIDELLKNT